MNSSFGEGVTSQSRTVMTTGRGPSQTGQSMSPPLTAGARWHRARSRPEPGRPRRGRETEVIYYAGLLKPGAEDAAGSPIAASYDPARDRWTPLPDPPFAPRQYLGMAWSSESALLFAWGGSDGPNLGDALGDGAAFRSVDNELAYAARRAPWDSPRSPRSGRGRQLVLRRRWVARAQRARPNHRIVQGDGAPLWSGSLVDRFPSKKPAHPPDASASGDKYSVVVHAFQKMSRTPGGRGAETILGRVSGSRD